MYFSSLIIKRGSHFLCLCLHLLTLPFSILQTHSLRRATGDFPVIQPLHSRIQLNHMSGVDKRSWNNASAAGPAKIKRQEVMSAYPPAASEGMGRIRYDGQRSPNGSVHAWGWSTTNTYMTLSIIKCIKYNDNITSLPVAVCFYNLIEYQWHLCVCSTGLKVQYVRILADDI